MYIDFQAFMYIDKTFRNPMNQSIGINAGIYVYSVTYIQAFTYIDKTFRNSNEPINRDQRRNYLLFNFAELQDESLKKILAE